MKSLREAIKSIQHQIAQKDYIVIDNIGFGAYKAMITFVRYHSFFDSGTINIYMEDKTAYGNYMMPLEAFNDYTYDELEKICQSILMYCLTEKEESQLC